ncbi:MAG TPA: hypothetical protein VMD56_07765 [Steroidobacteraceae bacterium]|nr:hypothetical protein [Steroidobacteraceae bacterium]
MRILYTGVVLLSCALGAQAADEAPTAQRPIDHGKLAGVWVRARTPGGLRAFREIEQFLGFQLGGPGQTGVIIVPSVPPLRQPYLTQWQAHEVARHEADLRGQPFNDEHSQCMPDGMPSMMMGMFPMEVLQAPGEIAIVEEAYRQIRHIYLNQKQIPVSDAEPEFWGHSVGHWQGDTLIVNTVGIKDSVRLEDVPHSDQMQIDERIRLLSPDRYQDAITVSDPAYLVHPWSFTWTYQRDPGYKLLEYVCEDNRDDQGGAHQSLKLFGN